MWMLSYKWMRTEPNHVAGCTKINCECGIICGCYATRHLFPFSMLLIPTIISILGYLIGYIPINFMYSWIGIESLIILDLSRLTKHMQENNISC